MSPSEQARWKKDNKQTMTRLEKCLYLRATRGFGLREAIDWLEKTGNSFDGHWKEDNVSEA